MRLSGILEGIEVLDGAFDGDTEITGIVCDSRKVRRGSLFVCIEGFSTDGHRFAAQAAGQGAAAILVQKDTDTGGCPWIRVADTRTALAQASRRYFDDPCARVSVTGVTGTAGKTGISFLFRSLMEADGRQTGLIGPVANIVGGESSFAVRSTPESNDLMALLDEMDSSGTKSAVLEVSSQGIQLGRIDGCVFSTGVFSNLYSDFVGISDPPAFREALDSKIRFARLCRTILVNRDAEHTQEFLSLLGRPALTYGLDGAADIRATNLRAESRNGRNGTRFTMDSPWFSGEVFLGLPCRYHVSNALAAMACAALEGADPGRVRAVLAEVRIPGCVEPVGDDADIGVYVDSAHTPQTLDRLLTALRAYTPGRLTCVFGCSGNTTAATRSCMGRVVSCRADRAVIVPDNPYLEDVAGIASEIAAGFEAGSPLPEICGDRSGGIALAIEAAAAGDVVVIAGKGHHNYQMFGNRTEVFSDAEHAARLLNLRRRTGDG